MGNPTSNKEKYRKIFVKYGTSFWLATWLLAILAASVVLDTLWGLLPRCSHLLPAFRGGVPLLTPRKKTRY